MRARGMEVLDIFSFHTVRKRVFECLNIARFFSYLSEKIDKDDVVLIKIKKRGDLAHHDGIAESQSYQFLCSWVSRLACCGCFRVSWSYPISGASAVE